MTSQTRTKTGIDRGLNQAEVAQLLGLHRVTVNRLTKTDPTFPRPARFGAKTLRWRRSEIEAWFDARQRVVGTTSRPVRA